MVTGIGIYNGITRKIIEKPSLSRNLYNIFTRDILISPFIKKCLSFQVNRTKTISKYQ